MPVVALVALLVAAGAPTTPGSPSGTAPGIPADANANWEGATLSEIFAAGGSVSLTPRSLDLTPQEIVHESVTVEYEVDIRDGFQAPAPMDGPFPEPMDPPFGTEALVTQNANRQDHASIAGEPDGSWLYIAYTNQSGTNEDVYVARSSDGGATWTHVALAAAAGYNEFEPRVVVHGPRVFVFFSMDDPALVRGFRYAISTNNGQTWSAQSINYGGSGPFRDMRNADAVSYNGQWLYAVYEANCDQGSPGNPPCFAAAPNYLPVTIMFDVNGAVVPPSIYFPFAINIVDPAIAAGASETMWIADIDASDPGIGGPPGSHDLVWMHTPTGQNTAGSWADAFISGFFSLDEVRVDAGAFGSNLVFPYQFIDPGQGFADHAILDLYTNDDGASYTIDLIAGSAGTAFKSPAVFASIPLMHVSYLQGASVGYSYSADAAVTWSASMKVNGNPGTAVDMIRATDITYASGVRVAWTDDRNANNDVFYSRFSGFAFYIFDRSPRLGTLDINGVPTSVPVAFLWPSGSSQNVAAPTTEPGGPGTRYAFQQWSDGDTNAARTLVIGSTDVTLVAQYTTEYFLDISTAVGTTNPTSSWYASGTPVQIEWLPPPPGAVRYTFLGWTGSGPGSYTGPANPASITMNGPVTEVAAASVEYRFIIDTNPTGLQVSINGTTFVAPQTVWWASGTSHTVTAISPQSPVGPLERMVFVQWQDGPITQTRPITATAPMNLTADYRFEVSWTITPSPADCDYIVDGTTYGAAQQFWFVQGSSHLVDVTTPQVVTPDIRYVFASWSDGGTRSHTITASTPQTLDLTCNVEHRYRFDTSPSGDPLVIDSVSTGTPTADLWWLEGTAHTVQFQTQTIGPDTRRVFVDWSDASTSNPRTFTAGTTATGLHTVNTALEYRYVFTTSPAGLGIVVDGSTCATPCTQWWRQGSTHQVSFTDVVQPDTRQIFQRWSDGDTSNPRTFANVQAPAQLTAETIAEYRFQFASTPTGLNLLLDGVTTCPTPCEVWWTLGTSHTAEFQTLSTGPDSRRVFDQWADGSTANPRTFSSISAPGTFTLQTAMEHRIQFDAQPGGVGIEITVDGAAQSLPTSLWIREGQSSLSVTSPYPGTTGVRYAFDRWADGNTQMARSVTISGPASFIVQYKTQYLLTVDSGSAQVTATCSVSDCWYDSGTQATASLSADMFSRGAGLRSVFAQWTGAATGTDHAQSNPIAMDGPNSVTVQWQAQVLVLISTQPTGLAVNPMIVVGGVGAPVGPQGAWLDEGTTFIASVANEIQSGGSTWRFVSWQGGPSTTTYTQTADAPIALVAQYREVGLFESPLVIGGIIAIIVAALLIAFLLLRRRKEPEEGAEVAPAGEAVPPPPPVAGVGEMECPSCGMSIPAEAGPCPICGEEVLPPEPVEDERITRLEEAYKSGRINKEQYEANVRRIRGQ